MANQRVYKGKFLEVNKLINEEGMIEIEKHNFASPNESLDVGTEHQLTPKHHKE